MRNGIDGNRCHFRPNSFKNSRSACGVISDNSAYDGRDCTCLRCMKTFKYKQYMGVRDTAFEESKKEKHDGNV